MTDDLTMPLPKPPNEDPGETLRPVRPTIIGGETETLSAGADVGAGKEAAELPALKITVRRIKARKLGPYELLGLLGRGGMGAVYEAFDTRLKRRVALKVMLAGDEATTEKRERFRREAAHSAKLRHPNIVTVHDVGHEDDRDYLVMDLIEGATLGEALRQQQFTYREKAALLEKVARAVQHAHDHGVIHRDLKPGNIMLDYGRGGSSSVVGRPAGSPGDPADRPTIVEAAPANPKSAEPLVMDFGLAKNTQQESGLSQTGQAFGTPAYMAPEQAEGKAKLVGPRSDVYSLGAILYEMLAGRPPFVGENALQVLRAALHEEPVPPRKFTPGVPRDLETICLKCLEKEPRRRYASAAEFADDLEAFQDGEPVRARPIGAAERAWKKVRKNPAPYVVAIAALVVIVLGTAGFMYSLERKRREAVAEKIRAEDALSRYLAEQATKQALEKQKKREWQLVFEDDFSDATRTMKNWMADGASSWGVKDGELHAQGNSGYWIAPRMLIAGDIRIEFDCRVESEFLNDVSCFLAALPQEGPASGYIFKYGGWSNTEHALERGRAGAELWSQSIKEPIAKGVRYHVCAECVGKRLTYTVNGQTVFSIEDDNPLTGNDHSRLGLWSYGTATAWDNVKVYRLGEPLAADLLEIAERHLERGSLDAARELFTEVLASSNDALRRDRAQLGLDKSKRALAFQERLPELKKKILQVWPKAQVKTGRDGLIVNVADAGLADLTPLQGLPVTELNCERNKLSDLTPLKGMPLKVLQCSNNQMTSLESLRGLSLVHLACSDNRISTLEPLRGMKLSTLVCSRIPIRSLEPLRGMPLTDLQCNDCQIKGLEPLPGMALRILDCAFNDIESLEPLRGMKLTVLNCSRNKITSLAPLSGMPLTVLECWSNQIKDLEPLRNMPLTSFNCDRNQIKSLEPLRGASLSIIYCEDNLIVDVAALRGMPLLRLHCNDNRLLSLQAFRDQLPDDEFFFACETLPDAELERAIAEWTKPLTPDAQPQPNGRSITALNKARRAAAVQAQLILAVRKGDVEFLKSLARPFKSHKYLVIHILLTWPEAKTLCEKLGGHLATLTSRAEEQAVDPLMNWFWGEAWIGLSRTHAPQAETPDVGADPRRDAWVTGEAVSYTHFEKAAAQGDSGYWVMTADHEEGNPWYLRVPPARNFFIIQWDD